MKKLIGIADYKTKTFADQISMENWVRANRDKYQIVEIFINNGYGVEYRELIRS